MNVKETMYSSFSSENSIDPKYFDKYSVKRGLRNLDGTGVMAGVTNICNVHGYVVDDGEKRAAEGKLIFRGYSINDLIENVRAEDRFGFEEIVFLLLTGRLPDKKELIQGVYTLNKSLFNALEIFRRYDSGYRIKREELLVENTIFVYAEFYTVTS